MTKHRFRDSIKSLFGSHIDPDKDEELKETKIEMDGKVQKILKLLKEEDEDDKSAIVELIEDFNEHYQSVYDRYDHLTGELRAKVHGKKGKDDSSSSSSSSDSDSDHSSKKKGSKNGKLEHELHKVVDGMKEELQTANSEIADLKMKLTVTTEEKEALNSEYQAALNKVQETDQIFEELKLEAGRLSDANSKILAENRDLNLKLEMISKVEVELNQKLEDSERDKTSLRLEMETAMECVEEVKRSNEELEACIVQLKDEKENVKLELEGVKGQLISAISAEEGISNLRKSVETSEEEKTSLLAKISELSNEVKMDQDKIQEIDTECTQLRRKLADAEKEILTHTAMHEAHKSETTIQMRGFEEELKLVHSQKREIETQKEQELSALLKKLEDRERDSLSQIEQLKESVCNLEVEVESLHIQKGEQEEQIKNMTEELNEKQQQVEVLQGQKTESEVQLEQKLVEISEHLVQIETLKQELLSKTEDEQRLLESKESYIVQVKDLELERESLQSLKSESDLEIEKQCLKVSECLIQIENLKEELANKTADRERLWEEKEGYMAQVKGLESEIKLLQDLKHELEMQLEKNNQEISEFLHQTESLKEELASKTEDHMRTLEEKEKHSMKVNDLELELASLIILKNELEKHIESKTNDSIQLQETLQGRIFEMERTLAERGDELSKLIARENDASAHILALTTQVNNLQEEIHSLTALKIESELVLEKRVGEISEHLIQIENLKAELACKIADGERMVGEKETLTAEVYSLKNQISELEEQVLNGDQETNRLREENEGLLSKISYLTTTLTERDAELSSLEKKLEALKDEGSVQIAALIDQLNCLQGEKSELESLIERSRQESSESLAKVEDRNIQLISKVEEHESMLRSKENDFSELEEEHRQLEAAFKECNEKLQAAENSIQSKEHRVDQLEEKIEELKREIEIKGDEVSTMFETVRNLEVKVRLSNQKLRITEQVLSEKEDNHNSKEEKFQLENKSLLKKISALSGIITCYKEAEVRVMALISEKVNATLGGMDALTVKFEEDYGHIETCVYEIMNEIQVAKSWVKEANVEKQQLQRKIQDKEEKESHLIEKVGELTVVLQKDDAEKENLKKSITKLEETKAELKKFLKEKDDSHRELEKFLKEKNEEILELGEEKREVIRQLCIRIDYQQDRSNYLKEMLLKRTHRTRQVSS